ncbi:MAG TPA: Gfo/Idh/MocA family oxidoreductase [Rhizomicrobium sp.]
MTPRRIALVGLGMAVTPHAKSLLDLKDRAIVVAAFSPSESRRKSFAAKFPFPLTDNLDAIVNDKSIDAVGVLTPPNTHLEIVTALARSGKHILLEKPLDISMARSEEIVRVAAAAGVKVGVMLQHRFKPAALRLAAILKAGELGRIVNCSTQIPLWRSQAYYDVEGRGTLARDGGGVLITQGIHTLDLMLSLAGPVSEVCGYVTTSAAHEMETEDLVCAAAQFESGAIGTIAATTAAYPGFPERIEFIGTKGTAALIGAALYVHYHDGRRHEMPPDPPAPNAVNDPMAFPHDYHLGVWRDFLDALDGDREPCISAAEALKVHRLVDALLAAGAKGGAVRVPA